MPFTREQFEATIRRSGRGVDASLRAFGEAHDLATDKADEATALVDHALLLANGGALSGHGAGDAQRRVEGGAEGQ